MCTWCNYVEALDVRPDLGRWRQADSSLLWIVGAGYPGWRRMSACSSSVGCLGVVWMSGRCRVVERLFLSGLPLLGGAGCQGSCRMSDRCNSTSTPLEALLDLLPCGCSMLRTSPWLSPRFLSTCSVFALGSNHVSHEWKGEAFRSRFTLCPMAYTRGTAVCSLGAWE